MNEEHAPLPMDPRLWRWSLLAPRSRQRRVALGMTSWLTTVWVLVFQDASWLTVGSGLLVALAVQWFFPLPHVVRHWHLRALPLARLLVRFLADLLVAGVQVSRIVVAGRPVGTGVLEVGLRSADPAHLTIVSAMTSLVPGTIVLEVDRYMGRLTLHVLDLDGHGGPEGVRVSVREQEERMLMAVASDRHLTALGLEPPGPWWGRRRTAGSRPWPEQGHQAALDPRSGRQDGGGGSR